ncbi:hypothetical protein BDK51DRAFT_34190 [Blyttiomyces helicus]|uniref:RUN domain-containing protein n=1 Tax=Blyttiomyces helicus TaxID=388810 RepID=A0A4P9WIZ8_9FUNG|nr:hypothetical protein BDK51DRAFT_34190 [Blyttiomyces helicus]|eukprot:RKO91893.1 hypothetical protein BDK51DRAFT_34190 [Blyttiomyces helicus]
MNAKSETDLAEKFEQRRQLYGRFRSALTELTDQATKNTEIGEDNRLPPPWSPESLLLDLCNVLSEILSFGFVERRHWLKTKGVWEFLDESLRKFSNAPDTVNLLSTVYAMNEASPGRRTKCYIKMALMQQTLGEHLRCCVMDRSWLEQWYEPWAVLLSPDEITPIVEMLGQDARPTNAFLSTTGMLQGLTTLEFQFCLRGSR